jgi:Flp pilus assembly protein TadG
MRTKWAGAISRFARRFREDRANVTLMFAMSMTAIFGLTGMTIDLSTTLAARAKLNDLADQAALSVVSKQAILNLSSSPDNGKVAAEQFFMSHPYPDLGVTVNSVNATVTKTSTSLSVTVSYSATAHNWFSKMITDELTTFTGKATASTQLPYYVDFYLLLDNSPSMGVAATPNDVSVMVANTPDQCAFACHDLSTTNSYYDLAHRLGVTMRIDVLRQATQALMDNAAATEILSSQFRMAIYTFSSALQTIAPLSSNLTTVKSQAASIDLATVPYQNYQSDEFTNFDGVFNSLTPTLPTAGDGSTPSNAQKVLFFVSDGVSDEANPSGGSRLMAPINLSLCTAIKNKGYKIAVLYTTYLPLPTNSFYVSNIKPFQGNIGTTMQSCASPGLYFEVSPTQGIATAMIALFQAAIVQARLAQ